METTGTRTRRAPYGNQSHQIHVRPDGDDRNLVQESPIWEPEPPDPGEVQVGPQSQGPGEAQVATGFTKSR